MLCFTHFFHYLYHLSISEHLAETCAQVKGFLGSMEQCGCCSAGSPTFLAAWCTWKNATQKSLPVMTDPPSPRVRRTRARGGPRILAAVAPEAETENQARYSGGWTDDSTLAVLQGQCKLSFVRAYSLWHGFGHRHEHGSRHVIEYCLAGLWLEQGHKLMHG